MLLPPPEPLIAERRAAILEQENAYLRARLAGAERALDPRLGLDPLNESRRELLEKVDELSDSRDRLRRENQRLRNQLHATTVGAVGNAN